jgi:hypothetical protein
MKQAVFITGFNNWGKTSIITPLSVVLKKLAQDKIGALGVVFKLHLHILMAR